MIKSLKNNISLSLFQNQNSISYNLFNKLYDILKCRHNTDSQTIKNFYELGYSKSSLVKENEIDLINNNIEKNNKKFLKNVKIFDINKDLRLLLKTLFINNFSEVIEKFSEFYSSRIIVSHVKVFTNHGFEKENHENKQFFSEKYHTDNYFFTYFKLFINLENVKKEMGPLHFVSKKNIKDFIKATNYKNRYSYNENNAEKLVFENIGKKGNSLFVNTTQCIHRAGIPKSNKTRTMLLFHLNAIPGEKNNKNYFEYENTDNDIFLNDYWSKYYAKPTHILKNLNLLKNFFN